MDGRTESPARARANGDSDGSPQSLRQRSQRGIRKKNLGVNRGQSLGSGTCRHHHAAPGGRVRCTHRRRARAWSQASQVPPVTLQPLGLRYAAAGVCLAVVVLGRVSRRLQAFGPQAATLIRYSYVAVHGGLRCRGKARAREPSICLLRGGGEATESLWAPLALGGTTRGYVPGDPQPTTARPSAARVDSLSKPVPFLAPPQFFSLSPPSPSASRCRIYFARLPRTSPSSLFHLQISSQSFVVVFGRAPATAVNMSPPEQQKVLGMPVSRSCLVSPRLPCRDLPREMPRELRRRDMVTGTSRRGIEASRDPIGSARIVSSLIQHLAKAPVDGPARRRCSVSSTTAAAIPGQGKFRVIDCRTGRIMC